MDTRSMSDTECLQVMGIYTLLLKPMTTWSMPRFAKYVQEERIRELGVAKAIEMIGEAASGVSQTTRNEYRQIDFEKLTKLRKTIVHAYGTVHINDLFSTLKNDIPDLFKELNQRGFIVSD